MPDTRVLFGAATVITLAFLSAATSPAKPPAEFVWLSDIHFDPTASPKLVETLAAANIDDWPRILASGSGPSPRFSPFGEDTNWALLSNSLETIRKTSPEARFTVVTGDILVHHFREKFESAAKTHDAAAFDRFAQQTIQFLSAQLGAIAPGKPVLYAIGNNDGECGDYDVQPNGAFLKEESASIKKLLGPVADETSVSDWTALGSYSVPHPMLKHVEVISVNSVYFSPKYQNACSTGNTDPAKEEMQWLERKLSQARTRQDKVWLIFHIPPGIDGYATARSKGTPGKTVGMWKPEYTEEFGLLLTHYRDVVDVGLAGHEHMDDFRLIANSLVLTTPALSPVVGQNPAFRVVALGRNGTIRDERTYYLANLNKVSGNEPPKWQLEYSFAKTWGLREFDFRSFSKLYREIEADPESRDRWSNLYSVSSPEVSARTRQNFAWLFCASGNATEQGYRACENRIASQLKSKTSH